MERIGQIAAIGKGTYTEIVDIVAPSSAKPGETVSVTVKIKNIWTASVHVYAIGVLDSTERFIDWLDYWIPAGSTHSFSGSFIMPNKSVTINAYSYYEDVDGYLRSDDSKSKNVALSEVYKGTISKKELEYDSARATIPAYTIPQNDRGLVHIWGRNDMTTNQKMGIWWQVKDPGGIIRETYAKWETLWTGPGKAQEFIGGRFNLDKPGTWRIDISLFMNPDDQEVVDDYYGTLCTVQAVVPSPEFSGFAISDYSKK